LPRYTLADAATWAAEMPAELGPLDHAIAGNRSRHLPLNRESSQG